MGKNPYLYLVFYGEWKTYQYEITALAGIEYLRCQI